MKIGAVILVAGVGIPDERRKVLERRDRPFSNR